MSSSFHKAVGYAMKWPVFEESYLGDCETHLTEEHLLDVLSSATDEMLTVDENEYREYFYELNVPSIWETRILSRTYTDGGRHEADIGNASDLVTTVSGPDDREPRLILFFPNLMYARRWQRRNDTLDLTFDRWKDGYTRDVQYAIEEVEKELPYGIDPFTNHLMLEDGTPEPWRYFKELQERPDIVPAVPSEIRFYAKKLGILDDAGVNRLRPYLVQWWT